MNDEDTWSEFAITVDATEFYSFVRALKRGYRAYQAGEVTITVQNGKLTMETRQTGCVLPFAETAPAVVAHVKFRHFCALAVLAP